MVRIMRKFNLLALLFLIISAVSCSNGNSGSLTGAGATFPLPYYNLMFKQYADSTGIQVNYGGIGSGGGIRSLKDKIVEFAGSDAFLSDEEMADLGAEVIHVPTCMGAVVMAYNIPGVDSLKLSGEIIAGIYSGEITKWNDNRIAGLNDGVKLPDLAITPVYRSDGSGTTFVFTDSLTKVSESWSSSMGRGKSLNWPCGLAAKGNPGVAGIVAQTEGAIGYVGSEYAFALDLKMASVMNRCGNFILPDTGAYRSVARLAPATLWQNHATASRLFLGRTQGRHHGPHDRRCERGGSVHHEFARHGVQESGHDSHVSCCHVQSELAADGVCPDIPAHRGLGCGQDWQVAQETLETGTGTDRRTAVADRGNTGWPAGNQGLQRREETGIPL